MPHLSRRQFLVGAAATVVAGAAAPTPAAAATGSVSAEPREIVVPDLDPAHDGLRVAQLSDLHVGGYTPVERVRAAIDAANRFRPDLVVLTGDYLTHDRAAVTLMGEQLGGLDAPTVATLGNHDRWTDPAGASRALDRLGYGVLENQNTTLTLRGAPFTVVGIDDLWTYTADPVKAMKGARDGSRLYLAHVPRTAELLARWGKPMLVLSGHTHGGQVNLPVLTPMVRWMIREPYMAGLYEVEKVQLYVNRGVGNVGMALRVNAPPEVSLLTLRAGEVARARAERDRREREAAEADVEDDGEGSDGAES